MGLLDTLLGSATGGTATLNEQHPLAGALGMLLQQNGGMEGLMAKFSQGGLGGAFASWVGTGQNQPISAAQIQSVLGSEQVQAMAAKMGVDPSQASAFLAEHLPRIVDKLTPTGQVDPTANHQQGLMALLPSLLESLSTHK